MQTIDEIHVPVTISGRFLVDVPEGEGPFPLLAGFHGYGQTAEEELDTLHRIAAGRSWCLCAVEALHHFYVRTGVAGASWMTSREREMRISENARYADSVLNHLYSAYPLSAALVLHGFSQGTAMAVRTGLHTYRSPTAVMLVGGDIPTGHEGLGRLKNVHLVRGLHDRIYSYDHFRADGERVTASGADCILQQYHGGHRLTEEYFDLAGIFLDRVGK